MTEIRETNRDDICSNKREIRRVKHFLDMNYNAIL